MNPVDWAHLNDALRILAVPLAGFITVQLQRILGQLRTLNGRMIKLEVKLDDHTGEDDRRFAAGQRDIDRLESVKRGTRNG